MDGGLRTARSSHRNPRYELRWSVLLFTRANPGRHRCRSRDDDALANPRQRQSTDFQIAIDGKPRAGPAPVEPPTGRNVIVIKPEEESLSDILSELDRDDPAPPKTR